MAPTRIAELTHTLDDLCSSLEGQVDEAVSLLASIESAERLSTTQRALIRRVEVLMANAAQLRRSIAENRAQLQRLREQLRVLRPSRQ